MAAAIPLGVGLAAGTATAAFTAASMATCINVGMMAMSIAQTIMASKKQTPKKSTNDYAVQSYTARSANTELPRIYGTVRLPSNLVWYGNEYRKKTKRKQADSRVY